MLLKDEKGQALYLAAMGMLVLMAFLGLGIDMGVMRYQRRIQQSAADAAAIAGASNLAFSFNAGALAAAQKASTENGFTDSSGGVNNSLTSCAGSSPAIGTICVQANNPPADVSFNGGTIPGGPHTCANDANCDHYVETIVAAVQPNYFMQALGFKQSTVTARAVAGNIAPGTGGACGYTLDPFTDGITIGIAINGNPNLNAPNCGIDDNGNFDTKGGAYSVTAGYISVSGQIKGKDNVTCNDGQPASECPTPNAPPAADPLAYLTPPALGTPVAFNPANIQPGTYNSNFSFNTGNYVFPAGVYILDGAGASFTSHGNSTFTGNGVMFYFTNGATWTGSGTDTYNLTAPSSGPYQGILFYQDPNFPVGPSIGGNIGSQFNGALYFPKAQVTFFGNTNFSVAFFVAGTVQLSGNPTVNLTGTSSLPPGVSFVLNSTLVE